MIAIQNPLLKKHFDEFSKIGSEAEKRAFWEHFDSDFETLSETAKDAARQDWKSNLSNVEKRLKEIGKQLDEAIAIQVFPANKEERKLIEALLSRMNVKYQVA